MRRRSFLQGSLLAASSLKAQEPVSQPAPRKKIAVIADSYLIHSTADNLAGRFLEGYWINDDFFRSPCDIASLYLDRTPATDVGARIAAAYRISLVKSVADALTLGTSQLTVDGILLVGDENSSGSRFQFFEKVVDVFKKTGRSAPVFCAGYLSENWDHAQQMYRQARDMGFPLLAGASEAVTFRRPEIDYPLPSAFDDAPLGDRAHHDYALGIAFDYGLVVVPGGSNAANVFSGMEILQSFLERRRGGETGIRSVECLIGGDVWRGAKEGRWPRELLEAALGRAESPGKGVPESAPHPILWLITYNDGTRGALLSLGDHVSEWLAAFHVTGRKEIDSTLCFAPEASRNDVSVLVSAISQWMVSGERPYPVERNLLTTGALSFLLDSHRQGKRIETTSLQIAYTPPEHSFYAHGRGW